MYVHLQNPASCKRPTMFVGDLILLCCGYPRSHFTVFAARHPPRGFTILMKTEPMAWACWMRCSWVHGRSPWGGQRQRVACLTKRLWMQSEPSFQMEKGPLAAARRFPSLGCPTNLTTQIAPRHCSWWHADLHFEVLPGAQQDVPECTLSLRVLTLVNSAVRSSYI